MTEHLRARPAKILLADDHALVRRGVRLILDSQPDLCVVAEVGDGVEAVRCVREQHIDLGILEFMRDYIHPNDVGQHLIADALRDAIESGVEPGGPPLTPESSGEASSRRPRSWRACPSATRDSMTSARPFRLAGRRSPSSARCSITPD